MTTEHWVVVDKSKLETDTQAVRVFGSIKMMELKGIYQDGKKLTYDQLRGRLYNNYWKSDRYVIKKCPVERNPRQN